MPFRRFEGCCEPTERGWLATLCSLTLLCCDSAARLFGLKKAPINPNQWGFWGHSFRKERICCSVSVDNDRSRPLSPTVRDKHSFTAAFALLSLLSDRKRKGVYTEGRRGLSGFIKCSSVWVTSSDSAVERASPCVPRTCPEFCVQS